MLYRRMYDILVGDGRLGYPEKAPYNAIHVGAAAKEMPQAVRELLNRSMLHTVRSRAHYNSVLTVDRPTSSRRTTSTSNGSRKFRSDISSG